MTFALSKILGTILSPGVFLALALAAGIGLESAGGAKAKRAGRVVIILVALALGATAVLPVGFWVLTPLENRFAENIPDRVNGIIVLGGDEQTEITEARGQPVALSSLQRYMKAAALARRYPDAQLVFTGGSPLLNPRSSVSDSSVAEALMKELGLPVERMVFERKARNTWENATLAAELVHPAPDQNWIVVTSAWHMPRALGCFRQAGWHVYPAPAGYLTTGRLSFYPMFRFADQMRALTYAAHEYMGLVSYRLMERTDALWPK